MREIEIKNEDRLLQIINKIITADSSEIKIKIPEESILFKNNLNLKIFQKVIDHSGKIAKIETDSERGKNLISLLRSGSQDDADFSKYQESIKETLVLDDKPEVFNSKKFEFPKINLPKLNFSNLKMLPVFALGIIVVFGLAYYFLIYKMSVNLEILVNSERFVKSFEIKLSSLKNTDLENKILRAESVSTVYQATKEIPTTGKVDGGKKAEGEVKLLNKTEKIIKLSKNTKITYKDSGKEYVYLILENIDVPARTITSTSPETFISGEKTVDAEANSFGSSYNIQAGKTLSVSGYSNSELSAVVSSSFEGGLKSTVNAVSAGDLDEVSRVSLDDFKSKFVFVTSPNKIILKNSESFSISNQKLTAELTQPADKLGVTQDIIVSYMVYDYDQALSFVRSSIKSLIPAGYELYGKDLQIELNSLGSISGISYDNKEANVQLTIRSYKIPTLDSDEISKKLAGKKVSEVSSYLDELGVNYNIESSSGLLNLFGFPKDSSKINVTVTKQ
jgi:hypothetical protein